MCRGAVSKIGLSTHTHIQRHVSPSDLYLAELLNAELHINSERIYPLYEIQVNAFSFDPFWSLNMKNTIICHSMSFQDMEFQKERIEI